MRLLLSQSPAAATSRRSPRRSRSLPATDVILDGEVTWALGAVAYHVFDILWLDGRDVTLLPLDDAPRAVERAAARAAAAARAPRSTIRSRGSAPAARAGRASSRSGAIRVYEHRRSKHWLKMKCEASQAFVVGGFTDPQGGRVGLGALLVGYFDGDDFVFAGKVGTGFDTKLLLELRARSMRLEIAASPFTRAVGLPRLRAHWVRPEVVVQVAFIEWTVHGKLRHSRLLGVRADTPARRAS